MDVENSRQDDLQANEEAESNQDVPSNENDAQTCEHEQEPAEEAGEAVDAEGVVCWEHEREDLINQILRLKADFDNYKRRNQSHMAMIRESANKSLITELLPVVDNFQRALGATKEESSLFSGVKMIYSQLMTCLQKQGLEPIECIGQTFDPQFHEAVSMDGADQGELVVTVELQKGYIFNGQVLRASMVQVAQTEQEEEE